MEEVSKSDLKARMFEYFRRIEATKRPLVVCDYGKPVLVIYPYAKKQPLKELFAPFAGRAKLDRDAVIESESEDWVEDS